MLAASVGFVLVRSTEDRTHTDTGIPDGMRTDPGYLFRVAFTCCISRKGAGSYEAQGAGELFVGIVD